MNSIQNFYQWLRFLVVTSVLTVALAGCSGQEGATGAPGVPGPGVAPLAGSTSLSFTITGVTIPTSGADAGKPTVTFKVTNQDGVAVAGFGTGDLRFNISKLVPGSGGAPSKWQNYINVTDADDGLTHASQERGSTSGAIFVDNKDGTYSFTFATDITNAPCPAPCAEADGTPLNVSYVPTLTHRITIQQGNTAYPLNNVAYDFRPSDGATTGLFTREIVKTESCNACHNQLAMHGGSRIDTKLCVTCHNPGTSRDGVVGTVSEPVTVDFKVMIHKIHRGEDLPSVVAGGDYAIWGYKKSRLVSFKDIVFPFSAVTLGDTRDCAKCHTGTFIDDRHAQVTADGDNWKTQPSKAACSSCHDDVYFGNPGTEKAYQSVSHIAVSTAGGAAAPADPSDGACSTCHGPAQIADVEVKHNLPVLLKTEGARFSFNILEICGSSAATTSVICGPGTADPTVKFSITKDGVPVDIINDPDFACVPDVVGPPLVKGGAPASVSILMGWDNVDENNAGSGSNPAQPLSNSVLDSYSSGTGLCSTNANITANGGNLFTLTFTGKTMAGTSGSGRVAMYGRVTSLGDADGDGSVDRVRIQSAYKDFRITDATATARRTVVDINKCDKCHDQVSLHGDSRTNEPGLCVICHNPNATDVGRRPKGAGTGGLFPDATAAIDGKTEEAIDFKRLIHGVHAGSLSGHGIREKGLVVYGYSGPADFSDIRFPGIIKDCSTCHDGDSYALTGKWEVPTLSGILGSTTKTVPDPSGTYSTELSTPVDDENISPTAAVCSACHDGVVAKSHMTLNGAQFDVTQDTLNLYNPLEACAICHGPDRIADVKVMHGVN